MNATRRRNLAKLLAYDCLLAYAPMCADLAPEVERVADDIARTMGDAAYGRAVSDLHAWRETIPA
jgi:hypothetical protein